MKNIEKRVSLIFAIVGLGMIIVGLIFGGRIMIKSKSMIETPAEISRIHYGSGEDDSNKAYVTYCYNGEVFADRPLGYYSSNMHEGKIIEIEVDPNNPNIIYGKHEGLLILLCVSGFGLVFFSIGGGIILKGILFSRKKKRLMSEGTCLNAVIKDIRLNTTYAVNGQNPSNIIAEYDDIYSGKKYEFKSENIWGEKIGEIEFGGSINVYVDRQDYSKYCVDVDSASRSHEIIDYT